MAPAPMPSTLPATGEVAPGVHVANVAGFNVMAVEFEHFVVAVEAPDAHPGFEQIPAARPMASVSAPHLAWLRGIARGRPVRYAIVSHHHSDHLGGVRGLAALGATILVSPGDASVTQHSLRAPHVLADGWGELTNTSVEVVPDRRVIQQGTRRVEVIQVGSNPHTTENLFLWLPEERILFQGDLFYYSEGASFPPSGREVMNRFFAGWLAERGIEPIAIYGVHNDGAAGPDAVRRARAARPR
jgi:glyoxylase-like metal-dependent hydrolase (beta-lactamase superfamily II)